MAPADCAAARGGQVGLVVDGPGVFGGTGAGGEAGDHGIEGFVAVGVGVGDVRDAEGGGLREVGGAGAD